MLQMLLSYSFHSLKDEFFIRHNLQRQSATLHHATVGYAVCCIIIKLVNLHCFPQYYTHV